MNKNTAYMSRADVIVLMTAHLAPAMIADHGASDTTPKRIVDFAAQLADALVSAGVVDAPPAPDDDKGGPFTKWESRQTADDDLDLDEDDAPEVTTIDTEPSPAPAAGPEDFGSTDAGPHLDNSANTPAAGVGTSGAQNQS